MSVASEALSGVHKSELLLFFTLLQLCVIVLAGRIGANLALRWGQSAAVGAFIIGIIFLGEQISALRIGAAVLIVSGLVLMKLSSS